MLPKLPGLCFGTVPIVALYEYRQNYYLAWREYNTKLTLSIQHDSTGNNCVKPVQAEGKQGRNKKQAKHRTS